MSAASAPVRSIAIVGSGFSGTATAVHLLRAAKGRRLRISLIERGPEFCRGVAYARTAYPYLLNVPASRMSATSTDPDAFLTFARSRNPNTTGEDFLPRSLYGEYLQDLLNGEMVQAGSRSELDRVRGEAIDLALDDDQLAAITLSDGRSVSADAVVLALGTPLPRLPTSIACSAPRPAIRSTPWYEGKPLRAGQRLLVIGTSLTMIDVVADALHRQPLAEIHAISRHGLVPPSQTAFRPDALESDGGLLASTGGSLTRLVAAARSLAARAERCGGDWREVVTLLRRQAPALWSGMADAERDRFLRHVRAYWDIHRHRAPATVLSTVEEARADGRLQVHAGRVQTLATIAEGVRATWVTRAAGERRSLDVSEVVDCSGPDYDVTRSTDRLWQSLLAKGLAIPDDLRLGIRTGPRGALRFRDQSISTRLFYIGPMLRADHWEATAVGELRTHAEQLATHLVNSSA